MRLEAVPHGFGADPALQLKHPKLIGPTARDLYQRVLSGLDCSNPVLRCSLVEKAAVPVKLPQPRFFATNTPMPEPEVADCQSGP